MWIPTRLLLDAALKWLNADTVGTPHYLANSFLVLLQAPPAGDFDLTWGDVSINECNYNGYARHQITQFGGPVVGQNGSALLMNGGVLFTCEGSDTVNTVAAQALLASDSVTLLGTEVFDVPIPMASLSAMASPSSPVDLHHHT
jgi:hypothetical protein